MSSNSQNSNKIVALIPLILIYLINCFIHYITIRDILDLNQVLKGSRITDCALSDMPIAIFFYLVLILLLLLITKTKIKHEKWGYRILLIILGILLLFLIGSLIYFEIQFEISQFLFSACEERFLTHIYFNIGFLVIEILIIMIFYFKRSSFSPEF